MVPDNHFKNFLAVPSDRNAEKGLNTSREFHEKPSHSFIQQKIKKTKQTKKDLILNTFYMNDFSENIFNKNTYRQKVRKCIIYPEERVKVRWDLFITL